MKTVLLVAFLCLFTITIIADEPESGKVTVHSPETSKQEIIKQREEHRAKLKEKATALVAKMTLDEKLALVDMKSHPVERFDIPAHHWWSEALSGVARNGSATQFPQSIAMASTWNPLLIEEMAFAISSEARAKYHAANEPTGHYRGLTLWSPTINLARDPRWGRNEETYGEDPWLTSRIALGFVKGLQGYDSQYLKTVATVKHFIANNHENGRTKDRPDIPEQFLRDYYMIPYKAAVEEGGVQSIMTAYSGINDIPCTMHKWLLTDVLRDEWGFDGTIVTDVGAPKYLSTQHKVTANEAESSAEMIKAGVNVICHFQDFRPYVKAAIQEGLITEEQLEQAVIQNLTTRMELGQVIDDSDNPYKDIPGSIVGSPEHRDIARKIAQQGTVLLKNENDLLPIDTKTIKRIVVAGPYGNVAPLGGYSGTPTITPITPLAGISKVASGLDIEVINQTSGDEYYTIIPAYFRPAKGVDGTIGLKGEYFKGTELEGVPSATRLDQNITFNWPKPIENIDPLIPQPKFSVRWTGELVPDRTGKFRLAVDSDDGIRVWLENELIIDDWHARAKKRNESKSIPMEAGEAYDIRVEYFDAGGEAIVNLLWMLPPEGGVKKYDPNSTMIVYVGGFDIEDADEYTDLMNLELKKKQVEDLQKLYSEYPNTVVILNGGTIVPSEWLYANIPAIMHAWYLGQEGGDALADLLFGKVSPSGHLPITSYASANNLPPIKNYDLSKGRTYMYHEKPVTFPFGHGLSYTEFNYGAISVDAKTLSSDNPEVTVELPITNIGDMTSDDVVQVYIKDLERNPNAYNPKKQLCGFQRISLNPNETKQVTIKLDKSAFSYWDTVKDDYIVDPGAFEIQVGTSSEDIRDKVAVQVE